MGGIAQLINTLATALGIHAAPWAAPAAFVGSLVLFWPWIRGNVRTADARKALKHAARERGAERERMEKQALDLVKGQPDGLVVVAQEALEQGRNALAEEAVRQLRATNKLLPQLRLLERKLEPPLPILASEAVIVIEKMAADGLVVHARTRLEQALRKWPKDAELQELAAKMAEAPAVTRSGTAPEPPAA